MRLAGPSRSDGGPGSRPVQVDADGLGAFLENHPLALVDVWAAWCGPCRTMEPIVEELAHEWGTRWGVGKLDADLNQDVLTQFGIQGIPTFLFFRQGKLAARLVGARPKRDFLDVAHQMESASARADPSVG